MDYPKFIVSNKKEESINKQRVNLLYPYSTQAPNPTNWHDLTNIWIRGWIVLSSWRSLLIRTVRSEFLQFVGLSGIRLKSFELFKTLATNSPIRKIVRDSYQIPKRFLDIVTES